MKIHSGKKTRDMRKSELGATQNLLLGVLASLVALLGYLYFFTGVIKEREVQQNTVPDVVRTVKKPIPPRPAVTPATKAETSVPQPESKPKPAAAPVVPVKAQASQAPAEPPKASSAAPPAKQPVVAAKTPPKPEPQKTASKPSAVVAQQPQKQQDVKPVKQQNKASEPAIKEKKAADHKAATAKPSSSGRYRVVITGITSTAKADSVLSVMKKGGMENIEKKQVAEEKVMKRLFIAEFNESQSAHAELDKLKKLSAGAFLIPDSGRYELYSGSYDQESRAKDEARRLSAQGLTVTIRQAKLKIPVTRITAVALDRKKAEETVTRLGKLGITSSSHKVEK